MMNREEMLEHLRVQVVNVSFIKANGETRDMACTLSEEYIPEDKRPKAGSTAKDYSESVIRVFDVEKQDWRSFRVYDVMDFTT